MTALSLPEIADRVGTPTYVYDADLFRARIAQLEAALSGVAHQICYAVKANDALALLSIAAQAGLGADIVSGGELAKVLHAGVPPERIVFSGVGKRREELRAAIEHGIRSINVESLGELEAVAREAERLGKPADISVRLNPDVSAETHAYISTGSAKSKFGLGVAEAREAYRRAAADSWLEPVGISFHVGSQLFDFTPVLAAAGRAAELWQELEAEGIRLRDFDCGGGIGIHYEEGQPKADERLWAEALAAIAHRLGATLVVEPGRWLVAPVGQLLTRVLYVKDAPGRRIAVCDAGMNDLIRPALYSAYHPIETLAEGDRPHGSVDIVGPICETGDFFALGRELPLPEPGDLLVVGMAGAYGRVMASTYNAHPLCAEVLVQAGKWRLIRQVGSFEDLVRHESF